MDAVNVSTQARASVLLVGQAFETGTLAYFAVQDDALQRGKSVKLERCSGMDRRVVCTSSGCGFFVQIYRRRRADKTYGMWCISSIENAHTNCVSIPRPTRRQIAANTTFSSAVRASHSTSARALMHQVQTLDGVSLAAHKRTVYRARETVSGMDSVNERFKVQMLPSFLENFARLNPGTAAFVERDIDGKFKRAIVVVKIFVDATAARQNVLGIDCAHSKCPYYSGVQMHLLGRDGGMKNITIAVALVPAEDTENYSWFLRQVRQAGLFFAGVPLFCDRSTALLSIALAFDLNLKYCTLHIIRNVAHKFGRLKQQDMNYIWRLQACDSVDKYKICLGQIEQDLGLAVRRYLEEIEPARWCLYANIGVCALYGWRTSNFVEGVFGSQSMKEMRALNPFKFFETLCLDLVDDCFKRSTEATVWASQSFVLTPAASVKFELEQRQIGSYIVRIASDDIGFVYKSAELPRITRRVTLSLRQCTCAYMDQYMIPCRHLQAVLRARLIGNTVFDYFDQCYRVESFVASFESKYILVPIETEITRDVALQPSVVGVRKGRNKMRRIRSNGENLTHVSVNRCSLCKQTGHNRRSCSMSS